MALAGIFAIVVGLGMIGQWAASYLFGQIPELQSEPIRIWFHIAGEVATAVLLIAGGVGLLAAQPWARAVYLVAMGMLLYTVMVSPGYFAQKGQWRWVLIFGVLFVLTIASMIVVGGNVAGLA